MGGYLLHPSVIRKLTHKWGRAGTKYENMSVAQIVISTAPYESQTLAFTYASLALNNSFFLHHLVSPRTTPSFFLKKYVI